MRWGWQRQRQEGPAKLMAAEAHGLTEGRAGLGARGSAEATRLTWAFRSWGD